MATEKAQKVPNGDTAIPDSIPDSLPVGEPEPDNTSKLKTFLGILRKLVMESLFYHNFEMENSDLFEPTGLSALPTSHLFDFRYLHIS